jgi:hypothetical protein
LSPSVISRSSAAFSASVMLGVEMVVSFINIDSPKSYASNAASRVYFVIFAPSL